ncbi:MAG: HAMP domain-containing protein [Clostridia bacterium]|nr:HAMP domain-containing protein [Clostridia bacterium]
MWFNIFIRIAVIFAVFVLVLCVSNVSFLVKFFSNKEKSALKEQLDVVSKLDFDDSSAVIKKVGEINEKYNFDVEIYDSDGSILYTTHGGQMLDYFHLHSEKFHMSHEKMYPVESETLSGGIVFETAVRPFDKTEYLLCRKEIDKNLFAEVRVQKQLISNSASIANEFIVIVSSVCFLISIIWVLVFARKFSKPITQMSKITHDMSNLNFERRLDIKRNDEIGELARSINHLSSSLSDALEDLKATNRKLLSDIELERQLDVMRRGFVANVSHELKTPISIISGYAEGLKLNINEESKEAYCNTIIEESHRMNQLVLSILELSRYESGQIPLNKQNFDVSVIAKDMGKRITAGKNILFENQIPADTFVYADQLQIEQVFKSLLENAVSHTPENGEIRISITEKEGIYKISVFNSGNQIPSEIMPQIWQSFFRGDKSHKRDSSRFGLGLSIVSAIMKMHGRNCGVNNAENGVEFWFEVEKTRDI